MHVMLALLLLTSGPVVKFIDNQCVAPLKITFNGSWYPYMYKTRKHEAGREFEGIDYQLLRQTLDNMQCKGVVTHASGKRAQLHIKTGEADIAIAATQSFERQRFALFSRAYRDETVSFIYRNKEHQILNVEDIENFLKHRNFVAINQAGWFGEEMEAIHKGKYHRNFINVPAMDKRFELLEKSRVQAVVEDGVAACQYLNKSRLKQSVGSIVVNQDKVSFMFSMKSLNQEFVERFDQELVRTLKSPQYKQVVDTLGVSKCAKFL